MNKFFQYILVLFCIAYLIKIPTGCAVIIPPGGGPKDTLPPVLVLSEPHDTATNVKPTKIVLTFDEFVDIKDVQTGLIVSPVPKNLPQVDRKLNKVTIKLKDSLEANTTYVFNFGNVIRDVNEGNIAKDFRFVFSTGNVIDKNTFSGKVFLAENGKIDSTLIVVLHNNLNDTSIYKNPPRYYSRVDSKGNFRFKNLPEGKFNAFVLPNEYVKKYDDSTKLFAFSDSVIEISKKTKPVTFYAYEEVKRRVVTKSSTATTSNAKPKKEDTRLKYTTSLENNYQDILSPELSLIFNRKIKTSDSFKIVLTDTGYKALDNYKITLDTSLTKISVWYNWKENTQLKLLIPKNAVSDSVGTTLVKSDTLKFVTKKESDYGSIKIRVSNVDYSKHPVLQFIKSDKVVDSIPFVQRDIYRKLFHPGEYDLRILYDLNKNGTWDPGNYKKRLQPEIVHAISKKLIVKPDYDNELEISL